MRRPTCRAASRWFYRGEWLHYEGLSAFGAPLKLHDAFRNWAKLLCDFFVFDIPARFPAEYFMLMIDFKFLVPRYLTNSHVIPQSCGVNQTCDLPK